MPTVPRYERQLTPRVESGPGFQARATPEAFGAAIGRGIENVGQAGSQLSDVLAQNAIKMQEEDNRNLVDEAVNQWMLQSNDRLYGENGFYTQQNESAVKSFPDAKQSIIDLRSNLAGTMPNDATRHAFDQATRQQLAFNLGNMSSHYAAERKKVMVSTQNANIDNYQRTAALNYNNEEAWNNAIDGMREATMSKAQMLGIPFEAAQQEFFQHLSKAAAMRVSQTALNDVRGASDLYDQLKDVMDPETQVSVGRQLAAPLKAEDAREQVAAIMGGLNAQGAAKTVAPFANAHDAGAQIMKLVPGTVVTSYGPAQSAAAKKARVPGSYHELPTGSQAIDIVNPNVPLNQLAAAVRQQYGDSVKVIVEGPGAKNSTGPHVHVQWEKSKGAAAPTTSVDLRVQGQDVIAQARDAALKARPGDLAYADMVEGLARQEVNQKVQAQQYSEAQSTDTIASMMNVNAQGGVTPNFATYMKDPQFVQAYNALPETKQRTVMSQINSLNKQGPPETPSQTATFHQLWGMQWTAPQDLLKVDLMKEDLTPKQRNQLTDTQARIAGKKAKPMSNILKSALADPRVKAGLAVAGMNPKDHPEAWNSFLGKYDEEINNFQAIYGQPPKPENLQAIARNLMLPTETGMLGDKTPLYAGGKKDLMVNGVPDADAVLIGQALRAKGIAPTPALIKQMYTSSVH